MILSLILPGMGLVYLGDRDRGLKVFIPSVILLVLVVMLYRYSEPGSMGVRVDSLGIPDGVRDVRAVALRQHRREAAVEGAGRSAPTGSAYLYK